MSLSVSTFILEILANDVQMNSLMISNEELFLRERDGPYWLPYNNKKCDLMLNINLLEKKEPNQMSTRPIQFCKNLRLGPMCYIL